MLKSEEGSSTVVEMTVILPIIFVFLGMLACSALLLCEQQYLSDAVNRAAVIAQTESEEAAKKYLYDESARSGYFPFCIKNIDISTSKSIFSDEICVRMTVVLKGFKVTVSSFNAKNKTGNMAETIRNTEYVDELF